jgi:ABC-type Zn2+ transport system substrate-binding protein/surface adhesin
MQNLAKVSALKEFEQIEELVKKHDIDLQNEFQKGKKEGEDAEKEKYMQEKKEADKMNNEHMQKIQLEHIEDKQVWLCRALSCVCLTM